MFRRVLSKLHFWDHRSICYNTTNSIKALSKVQGHLKTYKKEELERHLELANEVERDILFREKGVFKNPIDIDWWKDLHPPHPTFVSAMCGMFIGWDCAYLMEATEPLEIFIGVTGNICLAGIFGVNTDIICKSVSKRVWNERLEEIQRIQYCISSTISNL